MTSNTRTVTHDTPIGRLALAASETGLTRVSFRPVRLTTDRQIPLSLAATRLLDLARRELDEYFAGDRREFSVPVDLGRVEPRHRMILDQLSAHVGYGQRTTYGAIAAALGLTEDAPREVGAAMARNPVAIVVPCHRVLGAGGKLTGYTGGLGAKRWLLDLESQDSAAQLVLPLAGNLK
jgi:methylated-DNA-[protein]-cysteine S-methyltransferase